MPKREKISAVDTAWLRMDRPGNLMMICGVMFFRQPLAFARLRRVIEERWLRFGRFRSRPMQTVAGAFWEPDDHFDLDRHVVPVTLEKKDDRDALQGLVSRLAATPLDPAHPLWQFHLVEGFRGGSVVISRIHHCYADGIALIQVVLSMTDTGADGRPAVAMRGARRRRPAADDDDAFGPWVAPIADAMKVAVKIGSTMVEKGVELWLDPAKAVALAEQGGAVTAEIAKLALMSEDSKTRFKGKPDVEKRVAWADAIPLGEVKAIGKALGASVNDVLLSCVAGALRAYLAAKGDPTDGVMVRGLVPVNLRPLEQAYKLGNRFGVVFLELPIGIENPVERLYAVRANMRALKGSVQPMLTLGLLAAAGAGPKLLQDQLVTVLAKNATAVMTNVPGPQQPLWMAGRRIDRFMFWVPQSGDIGMGVSILSYDGAVQFGLITDAGLVPDPGRIIDEFAPEFEKLVLTTLLSPWPRDGDLDPAAAAEAVGAA